MAFLEVLILILILVLIVIAIIILSRLSQTAITPDIQSFGQIMAKIAEFQESYKKDNEKRDEIEKKREEREKVIMQGQQDFQRVIAGTKRRGQVGEEILKESLHQAIKAKLIKTDMKIDGMVVEFAWNLGDGKYVPIDAKFPEVIELYNQYSETEEIDEQKTIKKKIKDKIKKQIEEIKKYRNKKNTIDKVILALPDEIVDIIPEAIEENVGEGVIVCGYRSVFLQAHLIDEFYRLSKEKGDITTYQQHIGALLGIIHEIERKTETIDRSLVMVKNANEEIKKAAIEAGRFK